MILSPTGSYMIELPEDVTQDVEDGIASCWVSGSPLLLQLSSYQRIEGEQVLALERLKNRISKTQTQWTWVDECLCRDEAVDQACAEHSDGETSWLHCYFVWPKLTVYATISGSQDEVRATGSWAFNALLSLSPIHR